MDSLSILRQKINPLKPKFYVKYLIFSLKTIIMEENAKKAVVHCDG